MSEDRIERQIAFIIEQQAKNTVSIAQLQEGHRQLQEEQRQVTEHIHNLADALLSLTHIVEAHEARIADNSTLMTSLIEQGKETDARLNALIAVVERHVADHRT